MMRILKAILFFIIFLISSEKTFSQIRCATQVMHYDKNNKNPAYIKSYANYLNSLKKMGLAQRQAAVSYPDTIYTIPVVVHIVHLNPSGAIGGTNISDDRVFEQIRILNEDYRRLNADTSLTRAMFKPVASDVRIQFCLANRDPNGNFTSGITRNYSSKSSYDVSGGPDETALKAISYWPNDQYMNIWVAPLLGGVLGSTQYPSGSGLPGLTSNFTPDYLDGICIDYRVFGLTNTSKYNLGRTTTHEVGHYFGLFHIFEGGCSGTDYCADTPPDASYNLDSDCLDSSNCSGSFYTQDMTENYLDYSPDACMNMFSKDQVLRMRTAMQNAPKRKSLMTSPGCCGDGMNETFTGDFTESFENNDYLSIGWKIANPDTLQTWTQISSAGAWGSTGSLRIKNDSIYEASDPSKNIYYDILTSPFINFTDFDPPFLEFDLAYAKNTTAIIDSLVLSYNIFCDNVWTPLLNLSGTSLPTTSKVQNMFVPTEADWKHFKLRLPMLANKRFVRLRFEDYSKGGNNLYLDNINIPPPPKKLIVHFYPIPTSDIITADCIFNGTQNVTFNLCDMLGKIVLEKEFSNNGPFTTTLDVSHLAEGMYIFKASIPDQKVIKKIIIKH